eukprot:gene23159-29352_t
MWTHPLLKVKTSTTSKGRPFASKNTLSRIETIAGTGILAFNGHNLPATAANLASPNSAWRDSAGILFICDSGANQIIRRVDITGIISLLAGVQGVSSPAGTSASNTVGDGGKASSATFWNPYQIHGDSAGNLFVGDNANSRFRLVNTNTGIITTAAGNGVVGASSGDGGMATSATFYYAAGVFPDSIGNLYCGDFQGHRVRMVSSSGIVTTIVGTGQGIQSADGIAASSATLKFPRQIYGDSANKLYISDSQNYKIRVVNLISPQVISLVAGTGTAVTSSSATVQASTQSLLDPDGVCVDQRGRVYIAETNSQKISVVEASGLMSLVAGTDSVTGSSGDGGSPLAALLYSPFFMSVEPSGFLLIADSDNRKIRRILDYMPSIAPTPVPSVKPSSQPSSQPSDVQVGLPTRGTNMILFGRNSSSASR